jgi:[NiFe] hydrogenase assembly HybE family chaperone
MPNQTNLAQLEPIFQMILEKRMEGVPIINDRLTVKAVDFQQWHSYQLGILITPWFMNLILLPAIKTNVEQAQVGSKETHVFPSGAYEFIAGFEDGLGFYLSCSLFSPMFEFEDQDIAELTAQEALLAIMSEDNLDVEKKTLSERISEPTSRRDFLRGKVFTEDANK